MKHIEHHGVVGPLGPRLQKMGGVSVHLGPIQEVFCCPSNNWIWETKSRLGQKMIE
jgi:hypothetical protein